MRMPMRKRKEGHWQPKNAMADIPLSSSRTMCLAAAANYVISEVNYHIFWTIQISQS